MTYSTKSGRVAYQGKTVRGADAASFESLGGDWGRDQNAVYFMGLKVKAHRGSFRLVSDDLGVDDRRAFYSLKPPYVSVVQLVKAQRSSDMRAMRQGGLLFLVSGKHVFLAEHAVLLPLDLDADGFVALEDATTGEILNVYLAIFGSNYCLDAQWGSTRIKTPVQLWPCNGDDAQRWSYRWNPGIFTNAEGRVLDVRNGNQSVGTPLWLYDENDSDAQLWGPGFW